MGNLTEHFDSSEFACPCGECENEVKIDVGLVQALEIIRSIYDKPIHINSGVRCPAHNKAVGGKENSEHLNGLGADVGVGNSKDRYQLLELLIIHFGRIGIGKNFIHVGVSLTKTQGVTWVY